MKLYSEISKAALLATFCSVALQLATSSCVRIESADDNCQEEITYNLSPVKTQVKAATVSAFPTTSSFGVYACSLPQGKNWLNNASESQDFIINEEISYRDGVWKAWNSPQKYYWTKTSGISFFCWSPYNLSALPDFSFEASRGIAIENWAMNNTVGYGTNEGDGCTDILIARSLDQTRGSSARVQFTHALCKVSFLISLDSDPAEGDDRVWTVRRVELKDIYTTARFVGTRWEGHDNIRNYVNEFATPQILQAGTNTVLIPSTFVLPQAITRSSDGSRIPRIEVTCWDGVSYIYPDGIKTENTTLLTGVLYSNNTDIARWNEGTEINYHLYIRTTEPDYISFDASANSWTDFSGGDVELK